MPSDNNKRKAAATGVVPKRSVSKRAAKSAKKPGGREGSISPRTRQILWARSAGMCSVPGCGDVLHRDPMHFTDGCFGELAHNVAASARGPRGDAIRSKQLVDDPDNLIMMCRSCHGMVDTGGAEKYPEELLRNWKAEHEAAIELLASIQGKRRARILICTGKIRGRPCNIEVGAAVRATVNAGFRPIAAPFRITLPDGHSADGTPDWWRGQAYALKNEIEFALRSNVGAERTTAVFAVAEMPSLILLGYLLGDEQEMLPFQFDRTNGGCDFADLLGPAATFDTDYPDSISPEGVALVISATAPVDRQRVLRSVLGNPLPIVEIRAAETGRHLVNSPATIEAFRRTVMRCIDRIEALAGHKVPIHVFPAMPAPLAVALGATVMPKAPVKFSIYDSDGADGLFSLAMTLPYI